MVDCAREEDCGGFGAGGAVGVGERLAWAIRVCRIRRKWEGDGT